MNRVYTITEGAQEGAITLLQDSLQITIGLQEYDGEKYNEFLAVLAQWALLFTDSSWEEEGIETGNYSRKDENKQELLPLNPENILVQNNEVVGFVVGKKHYAHWQIPDSTVVLFLTGSAIGRTEYEHSYVWGDTPSETTFYHDCYAYQLVKKPLANEGCNQ